MHVNSEMPFSVYLKTIDDVLVRAPHDVEIRLEFWKIDLVLQILSF